MTREELDDLARAALQRLDDAPASALRHVAGALEASDGPMRHFATTFVWAAVCREEGSRPSEDYVTRFGLGTTLQVDMWRHDEFRRRLESSEQPFWRAVALALETLAACEGAVEYPAIASAHG